MKKITTMSDFLEQQLSDYEDLLNDELTLSVECYDEAMSYLISEYGLFSDIVDQFYKKGRTDEAIHFAVELGYSDEE
jgi:hypothetical protein